VLQGYGVLNMFQHSSLRAPQTPCLAADRVAGNATFPGFAVISDRTEACCLSKESEQRSTADTQKEMSVQKPRGRQKETSIDEVRCFKLAPVPCLML
jgi:hypothetical protein